jgi:hypothetical protein
MYDAQTDLLSYSYIESEVDGLFRAYLDTSLMRIAQRHESSEDRERYWRDVRALRKETINSKDDPASFYQYQYWFDVRSDYWSWHPKKGLKELVDGLVPAEYLKLLCDEARALEARLAHIEARRGELRQGAPVSGSEPSPNISPLGIIGAGAEPQDQQAARLSWSKTLKAFKKEPKRVAAGREDDDEGDEAGKPEDPKPEDPKPSG